MARITSKLANASASGGPLITLLLSCMMLGASGGASVSPDPGIFAFSELAPGFYRGGQPTEEGFRRLKALGIKTIVNFRNEKKVIEWEKKQVERLGMRYVSIPWIIYRPHDSRVAEEFLKILKDSENRPVFMHCRRGIERTGVMAALYYFEFAGLPAEEAFHKATSGYPVRWYWKPFVKKQFDLFKEDLSRPQLSINQMSEPKPDPLSGTVPSPPGSSQSPH